MTDDVRLTRALLTAEGITADDLARERRSGTRHRVRRGAWAPPVRLTVREAHLRLARAVCLQRIDVILSHRTAAIAWGLPVDTRGLDQVHVTRRNGHGRTLPDVVEHSTPLERHDVAVFDGLLITGVARTVVDLARTASLEWGVAAADSALHQGFCTRDDLVHAVGEAGRRHGIARARSVLEFADARAESPLESISRVQFARMPIPMPAIQVPIYLDGRRVATSDFAWEEQKLVGEADGAVKYGALLKPGQSAEDAVLAEKRRENSIRAAGWWVVRWGMTEALDPRKLAAVVVPQLNWADDRPRPRGH